MDRDKRNEFFHLLAGLVILFPGFDVLEEGKYKSAGIYFGLSILFLVVAGLHKTLIQKFKYGDLIFFIIEAVSVLYSANKYRAEGSDYLFIILIIFSVFFACVAISTGWFISKFFKNRTRKKKRRKSRTVSYQNNTFNNTDSI